MSWPTRRALPMMCLPLTIASMALAGELAFAQAPKALRDVPFVHWAWDAVAECGDWGVALGYPDGTFRGDEPITYAEAAISISLAGDLLGRKGITLDYSVPRERVVWDYANGIQEEPALDFWKDELADSPRRPTAHIQKLSGLQLPFCTPDGKFPLGRKLTRAEMYRWLTYLAIWQVGKRHKTVQVELLKARCTGCHKTAKLQPLYEKMVDKGVGTSPSPWVGAAKPDEAVTNYEWFYMLHKWLRKVGV